MAGWALRDQDLRAVLDIAGPRQDSTTDDHGESPAPAGIVDPHLTVPADCKPTGDVWADRYRVFRSGHRRSGCGSRTHRAAHRAPQMCASGPSSIAVGDHPARDAPWQVGSDRAAQTPSVTSGRPRWGLTDAQRICHRRRFLLSTSGDGVAIRAAGALPKPGLSDPTVFGTSDAPRFAECQRITAARRAACTAGNLGSKGNPRGRRQ
jgi:hypothetical protein